MKLIWAPWRIEYIRSPKHDGCIFCDFPKENRDRERLILYRGEHAFVIMNNYPYNPGHVMIAPYRHVGKWEELTDEELLDMMKLSQLMIKALKRSMNPDGFNLGVNLGRVAGAGIEDHVHIHIVPRWNGDTNFMPVVADTKIIPESLEETYKELKNALKEILGD
ncbi:HIT family hydrolase [Thermococci archaeon]|uniref:HIT family protein n=1 Tax=Palaeococcus sp. (in: euryarchaeotes) TaxID=2820298 RepID=UPI000F1DB367|nr:HIT domain-containing protein [Palaeococcus sp. (in: euryarchaeotes)]MCD6559426.1 HIT domain-containing protein [Palaeococcus sp. (in: euryarchaeotes)]RLF88311.1 MAG: HIT family hydrolase [Thermococci archaeon]